MARSVVIIRWFGHVRIELPAFRKQLAASVAHVRAPAE